MTLLIAFIGNLIDTLATLYLTKQGIVYELNPIMRSLLDYPVLFCILKVSAITAVLAWLWRERKHKFARVAAGIAAGVYGCIGIYYIAILLAM